MQIQILVTGGTLDKDYNPLSGELEFQHTHLSDMLSQANLSPQLDIELTVLMLKDSLEMTATDRETIFDALKASQAKKIVISHGTDTMTVSAEFLQKQFELDNSSQLLGKTIVFTGAMRPFKLGASDALFNLGYALSAAQLLPAGIFIAMNGQIHPAGKVLKNLEKGLFEAS